MFKAVLKINFILFFISSLTFAQSFKDIKVDGNKRISKESIIIFGILILIKIIMMKI